MRRPRINPDPRKSRAGEHADGPRDLARSYEAAASRGDNRIVANADRVPFVASSTYLGMLQWSTAQQTLHCFEVCLCS